MGWFGSDLFSALTGQSKRDKEKKARQDAERMADPAVAGRISQYRQKYPWLTAGAALAPAQAGLDVNDPALDRIAKAAANRKVNKGQGWFSIGQRPLASINGLDIIGRSIGDFLGELSDIAKPAAKWTLTALQSGPEGAQQVIRVAAKRGLGGELKAFLSDPTGMSELVKGEDIPATTTYAIARERIAHGEGAGIGQGYLPRGPALEEQARRARETQFLEYADHPLFTLPGYKPVTEQHAGTLGRNLSKDVFQPGSRPFNFLSGVIDAGFVTVTDPFALAGKAASAIRAGRTVFSAAEMGLSKVDEAAEAAEEAIKLIPGARTAREAAGEAKSATAPFTEANQYLPGMAPRDILESEVGLVKGVRPSIHPPTTQNWLTTSAPGRKFTSWVADNNDTYDIWKRLGGEKGNVAPDLAARMADTRSTDDVLSVLGDELGVGLRSKPITSRFEPVGGYLGEVRNSARSNRLLNSMPHSAVHLEDADESANQLVRLLRNGKLPEDDIGLLFNNLARAATTSDRGRVFMDAEVLLADHIASTLTGPISGRAINFSRLRGVFEKDLDAVKAVYQRQIGTNTEIKALDIDGQSVRLRSIHEDAEYFDTFYQLPDARAMRRITSQYGRLLNNKFLDVPIGLLDHMSSVWKGLTILRPALTLRVVGEEQVRMGAAGLDSIFRHPLSAIAWAAGRKGDIDILGDTFNAADELTAFAKSQAKSSTWRDRAASELRSVTPFTDPNFVKSWGNDIYKFREDELARRLAGGWHPGDLLEREIGSPTAPNLPPLYHGTAEPMTAGPFTGGGRSSENLFGPGLYATDTPGVAETYFKKNRGPAPTLYNVQHSREVNVLDIEQPLPTNLRDKVRATIEGNTTHMEYGVDDYNTLMAAIDSGSGADVYKAYKQLLAGAGIFRYDADEVLEVLNQDVFLENGIDAFKYRGGRRTGNVEHNAYLFLNPDELSVAPLAAQQRLTGDHVADAKKWLASPEAATYRAANDISEDAIDGYVENVNNWIKGKTYGNQSLLDIIATGKFNGNDVFTTTEQGHRSLSPGFQNHLKKLVDSDISPDHTISDVGDIVYPRNSQQAKDIRGNVTDKLFNTLLTRPSNWLSRSPSFRQYYWKEVDRAFVHGSKEAQADIIENAIAAGIDKSTIKRFRDTASKASGDLTTDELDMFAKGHALNQTKGLLYDLSDRNQLLDVMRLVFPFGEAWKEVMTTWAKLTVANPAIIPRAEMTVRGARGSGFFYTDPATGQEMFNYPGGQFVTKKLFGMPAPISAAAGSLNMFSNNPLLPGFGPLVQVPVGKLLPDTPSNDFIRSVILPYGEPGSPLPSWAQKIHTAFSDPEKSTAYANTVMDVARYLVSTGEYDTSTDAGKQALEDAARSKAKLLYIFRGVAQAGLPAAPSYQDIAQDKDGHTTLAFTLTNRYRELLETDDKDNTNLAVQHFIDQFGMDNLLYMQSASKGGEVFSRSGYNWVRDHPDIVSRYPSIYGLIAPNDGGFDIKAYQALFENGTRKVLPMKEALSLANHRAGKMILRNAQSKLPPPAKRTDAQRLWLNDLKSRLADKFPGFDAEYQGSDIPNKIAELSRAVTDPILARQPVTPAIRAYLAARSQVESAARARKPPIIGWQTAKSMKAQRQWLREVATKISARTPAFANVYDDLFDNELTDEEGA